MKDKTATTIGHALAWAVIIMASVLGSIKL
jgi:hypothetical protein